MPRKHKVEVFRAMIPTHRLPYPFNSEKPPNQKGWDDVRREYGARTAIIEIRDAELTSKGNYVQTLEGYLKSRFGNEWREDFEKWQFEEFGGR